MADLNTAHKHSLYFHSLTGCWHGVDRSWQTCTLLTNIHCTVDRSWRTRTLLTFIVLSTGIGEPVHYSQTFIVLLTGAGRPVRYSQTFIVLSTGAGGPVHCSQTFTVLSTGAGGPVQADHPAAAGSAEAGAGRGDDPVEEASAAGWQRKTHPQDRAGHAAAVVRVCFSPVAEVAVLAWWWRVAGWGRGGVGVG